MIFSIKADAIFEAENIDDAFAQLALHFKSLLEEIDSDLILSGEIEIKPVNE